MARGEYFSKELQDLENKRRTWVVELQLLLEEGADDSQQLDRAQRQENWERLIRLVRIAGVTDEDMQQELGASLSTIHRWLKEKVMPRETTQSLMMKALSELLKRKLET